MTELRYQSGLLVIRGERIVYASEGAAALCGREPADLPGRSVLELVVPEERDRIRDRNERRRRREPVPSEYETCLLRPDGARLPVELHVELRGQDTVVEFHALAGVARRPRLAGLAALGVAIQRERSAAAVHARVREALSGLSLAGILLVPGSDGPSIVWAVFPPELERAFEDRAGRLTGLGGRWTEFARAIWRDGCAFSDDWASVAGAFLGEPLGERARSEAARLGLSRAVGVRLEERSGSHHYLVLVGEWLRSDDLAAVRLFGAQIAAALDAAGTIADLSRRNDELATLNRIGGLLGEAADLEGFFRPAGEIVRAATGCPCLAVFVLDLPDGQLVRVHESGLPPAVREPLDRLPGTGVLAEVLRERLPRVTELEGDGWRDDLRAAGVEGVAWVPLVARSRAIGAMAVGFRGGREAIRPHLELLAAVGAHFASALESHGLVSALRRRVADLTLLNDVAVASVQLDPGVLLESVLRRMCETFQADGGAAFLREGDGLRMVASLGMSEAGARLAAQLRPGQGLAGLAFQRVAPVRGPDAQGDPSTAEIFRLEGTQAGVGIPLVAKSRAAVGALVLARHTPRPVTDEEVATLSAVGFQLGVAVENARLFTDVRRRLSDLEAVHGLALRIFGSAAGDVSALLEDACRELASALGCRGGVVALLGADGRRLGGAAGWSPPFEPGLLHVSLAEDQLSHDAVRLRAPSWTADATHDPRSALCGRGDVPAMSVLAVALSSRQATRGVLYLWDDPGRTFSAPELALVNALAGELAVGLENAELYAEARRRVEELSLLNEVGRTVAGSLDLDHVLSQGLSAACRLLGADHGQVILYDPVYGSLRVAATTGAQDATAQDDADLGAGGVSWRVVRERRAVAVEDADRDPEVNPGLRARYHARGLLLVPVLLRGEPLGVLAVSDSTRPRRFEPAEVERLTAVANQLAVALENARLYAEARGRLHELSAVIDVARVVSSSLDLEEVLTAGAEHLKQTLQASACTILLDDYRRRELRRAAARGAPIGPDTVPLSEPSLAREALEARAPVTGRLGTADDGGAPLLAVPLHVRDQPVGVALVAGGADERGFSPGELPRALAIASQLAVAVDNARLYSEARRRAEELGVLHEVGRSLVATLDFEQVLDAGARNLARIVDAPRALIALADTCGEKLEVRAQWGLSGSLLGVTIPVESEASLAAAVFERREPIAVEDARTDPRVRRDLERDPALRAALGLPLVVRGRTIGSVLIVETRGPRRFGAAEVERAAAVANQLAVAAENARLYEDLRRSYAELERTQRQLIQRERLAALGELSAVVAHEVRNPLGVIFNSLGSLRRLLRPEGDARMLLDIVGEEADRLNRIVGDLLDFARPAAPVLRPEPLDRVVDEAVAAALAQNPAAVELRRESSPGLAEVPLDARLVRQAVVNVAVNAVQAMPRGGRLTVRTRREGDGAVVEIEDTGAGVPEEIRGRMFEPFFTTKASGTGLGLAVVKRIVDGHGGDVSVRSDAGRGAAFTLRFPLHPPPGAVRDGVVETEPGIG